MFKDPGGEASQYIAHLDEDRILFHGDFKEVLNMIPSCIIGTFEPTLIVTDPPYSFASTGGGLYKNSESMEKIQKMGTDKFDFSANIPRLLNWQEHHAYFVNGYFFCNKDLVYDYLNIARGMKEYSSDILILDRKVAPPAHNNHYVSHIEYAMFLRKPGRATKPPFNGYLDLWKGMYRKVFEWTGIKATDHANEKPVALMKQYIEISSKPGDIVIDPFMGSGTTGVAAKDCGRKFIGIEKDFESVKLAVARFSQFSLF